jgi:hypothetical protein
MLTVTAAVEGRFVDWLQNLEHGLLNHPCHDVRNAEPSPTRRDKMSSRKTFYFLDGCSDRKVCELTGPPGGPVTASRRKKPPAIEGDPVASAPGITNFGHLSCSGPPIGALKTPHILDA